MRSNTALHLLLRRFVRLLLGALPTRDALERHSWLLAGSCAGSAGNDTAVRLMQPPPSPLLLQLALLMIVCCWF